MKTFLLSSAACNVLGILAISGASAYGQEGIVSWNLERNDAGYPVTRTSRQLESKDRIEIEVINGLEGLEVGIAKPAEASTDPKPSPDNDSPAPARWEKVVVDDKTSFRTKELANSLKITIKAEKVVYTRYVTFGVYREDTTTNYLDNSKPIRAASDEPLEKKFDAGPGYYKGLIQIGLDPRTPEEPKVESFQGYDKLTFTDGSVFIVKIAKAR